MAYRDLGDFCLAVKNRKFFTGRAAENFAATATATNGGYAVPVDFVRDIFMRGKDSLAGICQVIPTNSGSVEIPVDGSTPWASNGIIAEWMNEGNAATQRKPELSLATHKLKKLIVLVPCTEEFAADTPAVSAWLPATMRRATIWKMNDSIINGIGVGRPLGILNSGACIEVAKESAQTAATINAANIANMLARSLEPLNSVWVATPSAYGQLSSLAAFDSGSRRLAGLPIVLTDACPALGAKGDVILAGMSGYRLVTKGPNFAESVHLWFDQDLTAFRLTIRLDGQPILSAPTTPPNSATTRSHFVTLAART